MTRTVAYTDDENGRESFVMVDKIAYVTTDQHGTVIVLNYCLGNDIAVRPQSIHCKESVEKIRQEIEFNG